MKIHGLIICLSISVLGIRANAQYNWEYQFVSANPDVSGEIFLDAPSSSDGSLADVGPGSYVEYDNTPDGNFVFPIATGAPYSYSIQWSSSQITSGLNICAVQTALVTVTYTPDPPFRPLRIFQIRGMALEHQVMSRLLALSRALWLALVGLLEQPT